MDNNTLLEACEKGIEIGGSTADLFGLNIKAKLAFSFLGCAAGVGAEYARLQEMGHLEQTGNSNQPVDLQKDLPNLPKR